MFPFVPTQIKEGPLVVKATLPVEVGGVSLNVPAPVAT